MTVKMNVSKTDPEVVIDEVKLDHFACSLSDTLSMFQFDTLVNIDIHAHHICTRVRRELMAENPGPDPVYVHYPSTWWQHFKQRWFPFWLLRKFPVIMTTHTVDVNLLYPNIHPRIPDIPYWLVLHDRGTRLEK